MDRLRLDRRYLVPLFSTATFFDAVAAVAAGVVGRLAARVFPTSASRKLERRRDQGVVGSNPTDDFATHGHGHRRARSARRASRVAGAARGNVCVAAPTNVLRTRV